MLRDVMDCGGTVTLENDSRPLWIQSERDPLLRLSGCARHCTESWIRESQGAGGENVMVAKRLFAREDHRSNRLLRRETRLTWEPKCCRWRG